MSDELNNTEEVQVQLRGIKSYSGDTSNVTGPAREMHGRRCISSNETAITAGNVAEVLNKALPVHQQNRTDCEYLERYIRGYQPVLDRTKKYNADICNRLVVNIANEIVAFKTAEFAGEPIQYVSRGKGTDVPGKVERLNAMMLSEGKQSKDMELAYRMFTAGVGYRLVLNDKAADFAKDNLLDEAPFELYVLDPRNTFVIRRNDVTKRVLAGVTYVYLDQTHIEYTVYTDTECFVLDGTAQSVNKTIKRHSVHNLGAVPIVEYPCNTVYMGAFEVVLPLLDAINAVQSNRIDGIEQFIQAIMVFEGVDITAEQLVELKEMGAIKLPSGKVYYLNEQLDQNQTQTLVDDLYQTILQIVGMPSQGNGNTGDSSNNGAVILKNGWWSAEARSLETEGMWRQAETELLKIVLKICQDANALDTLRLSDVECKFSRRSYQDLITKTQAFSTLISAGVPPIQAYTISGMVNDPEAAAIQFAAYQEELEEKERQSVEEAMRRERTETVPSVRPDDSDSGQNDSGAVG